jgi:hypothetical protein
MKKFIIITSIFQPTEAIQKFAQLKDYHLIVVGDYKSPKNWSCNNVIYLSVKEQAKLNYNLINVLPYNHYSRKMIGYLKAIQNHADYIIDTDDDNIPKSNWAFPSFHNEYECICENLSFVNIYQLFTKQKIWPRGLPLNLINTPFHLDNFISLKECHIGIWQGLADEDPDVDAIYRLTSDKPCYFNERNPVVLAKGTICPFNTQNTIITKELFPLLYLPTYATFRFTDILRGLVAQPIMWLYDLQLGFCNATVVQKRNPHDYMKDFISEIPMYENCHKVIEIVESVISKKNSIENNLHIAYSALLKESIVSEHELTTLDAWLNDIISIINL